MAKNKRSLPSPELDRIRWLSRAANRLAPGRTSRTSGKLVMGIGDDAALWEAPPGHVVVLTVDVQVEGIHFRRGWLHPEEIGARAVATSASDLAAMAAKPSGILLALTLPRETPERFFRALYRGVLGEARRLHLQVLGGNLSAGPLQVTIASIGSVHREAAVKRAGARPGHGIYVTGWPGRAAVGQSILSAKDKRKKIQLRRSGSACLRAFVSPRARIREALFIARKIQPRAMIDLSDGLVLDLSRILEHGSPGQPGASLDLDSLLALFEEDGCGELAMRLGINPADAVLRGGEDYELLFTVPVGRAERATGEFRKRFCIPLTRVGTVERRGGLTMKGANVPGRARNITPRGYDHFR